VSATVELLLAAGAAAALTGQYGKDRAAEEGREITRMRGFGEVAKRVAAPLVTNAKERGMQAREERRRRKQSAPQGFQPFGRPAKRMPAYSYKNPSGVEEYVIPQTSLWQRVRDLFTDLGQTPMVKAVRRDKSGYDTPGRPGGDDSAAGPQQTPPREADPTSTDSEGQTMPQTPMYTSELDLIHAEGLSDIRHDAKCREIEQDPNLGNLAKSLRIKELEEQHNAYWAARRKELADFLATPEGQTRCSACGHGTPTADCRYACDRCGCEKVAEAADAARAAETQSTAGTAPSTAPAVPSEVAAVPLTYLEAVTQFAGAGLTSMPIPQIIAYLASTGEAFTQLSGVLHQLAARLDQEAMFDDRVLENIRSSATLARLAGIKLTSASQIAGVLYRQWIDASRNGARVPSQGVLSASNS
jgi:hypothetical protein